MSFLFLSHKKSPVTKDQGCQKMKLAILNHNTISLYGLKIIHEYPSSVALVPREMEQVRDVYFSYVLTFHKGLRNNMAASASRW